MDLLLDRDTNLEAFHILKFHLRSSFQPVTSEFISVIYVL